MAVDAGGRARYSPLWNKGKMAFALEPSDKHLWLTVAATPGGLPIMETSNRRAGFNTLEFVDFLLGFAGLDIAGDDPQPD